MSKALYGHLAGPDAALVTEVARLRRRVRELEAEVEALRAASDAVVSIHDVDLDAALRELSTPSPA